MSEEKRDFKAEGLQCPICGNSMYSIGHKVTTQHHVIALEKPYISSQDFAVLHPGELLPSREVDPKAICGGVYRFEYICVSKVKELREVGPQEKDDEQ